MWIVECKISGREDLSEPALFDEQEVENGKKDEEDEEIIFFAHYTELEVGLDYGTVCERLQPWNESSCLGAVLFVQSSKLFH